MTVRLGADATSTSISALNSLGATFVCRYVSPPANTWKNLTLAEADALRGAGIDIVTNWEYGTSDWQGGHSQGVNYAQQADAMHKACGGPGGAWIYFSVDQDADPQAVVNSGYFQGINSVIGAGRTGVYGSTGVCNALKAAGLVVGTWRTMSVDWNGGYGSQSDFNIEQTGYFNSSYDRDASITDDFGQWSAHGDTPPPPPPPSYTPPVVVTPPPTNTYQYRAQHNTYTPVTVDGYFGSHSWAAIQYVLGVTTDGIPGSQTIRNLQLMLDSYHGAPLARDGVLGPQTVKAFQEKVGTAQDGNWGTATSSAAQQRLNQGILYGSN